MLRERFEDFAGTFPEAMLLVTRDGVVLTANAAGRKALAGPKAAVEGRPLTDFATDAPERIASFLKSCARTRQMIPGALTLRGDRAEATPHRAHGALFAMREDPGSAVLIRLGAAGDVSRFALLTEKLDALTAEVARRRVAEDAVREREERLRVVLTSIGDAVIVTDPQGAVTFMNQVAESVTGWSQAEAGGRPLEEVFVIANESTGAPVESPVTKVLQTGHIVGLANHTVLLRRDGASIPIDDSAAPVRKSTGELEGVVLVFRAIVERKQAEREREQLLVREHAARVAAEHAHAEAERANAAKDEFLAMLGHELRNPLAPIRTALDLMRLDPGTNDAAAREVLERQVGHMVRLVDDLLDVSRIAQGKVELDRRRFELAAAVAKAVEMASPMLERWEQRLTLNVPARGLVVDGDVTRLSQVISNLLGNASKYTGRCGLITVTAAVEGGEVVLRVIDTGVGIRAEMLPRVFDMFAQERQTLDRSQGGLGLGLAIVRNLVIAHGGTVEAQSAGESQGSTFTIRLPAAGQASAPEEALPSPSARGASLAGMKLLVVDDNADAGTLLALLLRRLGHDVRVCHDGISALDAAEEFKPDVAFLDLGLPVMDGYELAPRLRGTPGLAAIRIIAVTGYGQDADRRRSEVAGFDVHLVKLVSREMITAVLDKLAADRH